MTSPAIKDHCSILHPDRPIKLFYCSDRRCGCRHIHCPLCDVDQFKPTTQSRVRDHLESTHFAHAVFCQGLQFVKCYHDCKEGSSKPGHYHCAYCSKTILKRNAFIKHLKNHIKSCNSGEQSVDKCQDVYLFAPDSRLPDKISLTENSKQRTEVNLCTTICDNAESYKHYHCPHCQQIAGDRSQLIMHWWRCQPPILAPGREEGFRHSGNISHPRDVEDIQWHISIVRSLEDLHIQKCNKPNCCHGKYFHCDLCSEIQTQSFSRAKVHYKKHWHKKVNFKDYSILPCYLTCEIEAKSTVQVRCHYHCPVCGETRRRRLAFVHHLKICRGDKHQTHSYAIQRSKEMKVAEDLQVFLDADVETSMEDACLDNGEVESTVVDIKQGDTLNDDANILEIGEDNNTKDLEEGDDATELLDLQTEVDLKNSLDLKSVQVFEETTAKISQKLVQALGSAEMRNLLSEICGDSLSFDTAPGISVEVFTLSGQVEELLTARSHINKYVEEKFMNDETTQTITDVGEDTGEVNPGLPCDKSSPVTASQSYNGSRATKKEIKQKNPNKTEVENEKNVEEKPPRRYGTRGVKLNFTALAHGRNEDSLANDKEQSKISTSKHKTENMTSGKEMSIDIRHTCKVDESQKIKLEVTEWDDTVDEKDKSAQNILDAEWIVDNYDESNDECDVVKDSKDSDEPSEKNNSLLRKEETTCGIIQHITAFIPEIILAKRKFSKKRSKIPDDDKDEDKDVDDSDDNLEESEKVLKDKMKEEIINNDDFTEENKSTLRKRKTRSEKTRLFSTLENGSDQDSSRIKRRKFKMAECRHCDFISASFADVTAHMIQSHPNVNEIRCDVCRRIFDKEVHLELHIQQKHGPLPETESASYSCIVCQKSFRSEQALSNHTERHHSGNTSTCAQISRRSEFHMCEICGKKFRTRSHLLVHKQSVHQKQNFTCDICQKTFSHIRYLHSHRKRHSAEKKYRCKQCGASYVDRNTLKVHMNIHKPEEQREYKFVCSYCGKKFMSKCGFNEHLNKHTGDKPFQCKECMQSFAHRSTLEKHKLFVHKTERPYQCPQCHKAFKLERILKQHLVVHTKVSNYVCEHCNKTYTCKNSLRQHQSRCKVAMGHANVTDVLVLTRNSKYTQPARKATSLLKHSSGYTTVSLHQVNSENTVGPVMSEFSTILTDSTNATTQSRPNYGQIVQNILKPKKETENYVSYTHSEDKQNEIVQNILQFNAMVTSNEAANHLQTSGHMTQVIMEESNPDFTQEVGPGDVSNEVYMCSECNTSFLDFTSAEQHVLSAHGAGDEHDGIELQLE